MKRLYAFLAIVAITTSFLHAQKLEPWQDPEVFQENRLPMRASFSPDQQQMKTLNGMWKFRFYESVDSRERGFESLKYDDSFWNEIPVPGNWELYGYGVPVYLNTGYEWRGIWENNPPYVPEKGNYVGQYRKTFEMDSSWVGKQVCLHIGSATSNVRVWVNGKPIGYSEDSKLEARFDISKAVKPGENLIALELFRWCDGTWLEDQDFWRLRGLSRDVYIYTREKQRLEDVNIVSSMDGTLEISATMTSGVSEMHYNLKDACGKLVSEGSAVVRGGKSIVKSSIADVKLWSAEEPYLYRLEVQAISGGKISESAGFDVGFRSVEIQGNQLLVNGKAVYFKGVNRHEMTPYGGYVVSEDDMIRDIRIMKSLNINAVRLCHYPNDPLWLTLCDRYGLYVIDEGNIESHGTYFGEKSLAHDRRFAKAHLDRDSRMVKRDRNHPSVIVWSLGNEAGSGQNFVDCYNWIKAADPTRPVQYGNPFQCGSTLPITDVTCPMYWSPDKCESYLLTDGGRPLIPCEYAHAMGNSMGAFKEYWELVRKYPGFQGGYIWDFQDQALWNGRFWAFGGDYTHEYPSDGSFNCNGLVAADRSLHPHAYEVRYQHRNILSELVGTDDQSLRLRVTNEFFFKDLSDVRLFWNIQVNGETTETGVIENLNIQPQESAVLTIDKPEIPSGIVTLNLSYTLKKAWPLQEAGSEIAYEQFVLSEDLIPSQESQGGRLIAWERPSALEFAGTVSQNNRETKWSVTFDKTSGAIVSYNIGGQELITNPLIPCFNRAPVENDLGARFQCKYKLWRNPDFIVDSIESETFEQYCLVDVKYKPLDGKVSLRVSYKVLPNGTLHVVQHMAASPEAPDMFRFGMRMAMPGSFDRIDFFGLGPWENYIDRCSSTVLGHYRQLVADQYHMGYVRTQESGTHGGLRFFRVINGAGCGLEFRSVKEFSASALPYSLEQLDVAAPEGDVWKKNNNNEHGIAFHSLELEADGNTYLHVDAVQMGLGGITSWGQVPLDKYTLHPTEREFSFTIRPLVNL